MRRLPSNRGRHGDRSGTGGRSPKTVRLVGSWRRPWSEGETGQAIGSLAPEMTEGREGTRVSGKRTIHRMPRRSLQLTV
ncbi:hypothetical protein [Oxynema aestuarii]|uniref:Uncharacterized protein n=1 Tax=Oxynema aestuarii AP17 TaxID=2064643 RepID=A0A6H1U2I8_9CYAN|nr:hypothetical protein [Oxynema aestuarii]QIZ72587.1 hypothetical protein HCG48_19965 [Oxynema aestuarii AP17]